MHIQSFLLPQWKWFVDYANVGNRIWLAWDDNAIDVHILDLGEQYIHCRVMNRADSEIVIITVVYGASEVIGRRALWNSLQTLAPQCVDVPWLVGGDFNAVRDINEVCGISGDIRIAMEDFNNCIQEAGLLPMPMQAECVQNIWQHEVIGVPMYAVTRKLKALKLVFRQQRRNKGDLSHNVQLAKGFLDEAQNLQRAKMQWMKEGDQCSRVFFRKIAQRRAGRRILQINDENGSTHIEPEEVIHEFVSYYQNLLGGNRRQILVDINYLRPWARHIITNEEASHLCLPFTPKDVKNAVFDISEDKAPGPNGYSSGFFKAAWPVVGTEVTRAVLNFFTTGKLLKQVNSTLLALIPKHLSRDAVLETTFCLLRNCSRDIIRRDFPLDGALKVDIRKAYDTVEWDFLVATSQLFGFPPTFIRWIEECISTTSFSGGQWKANGFFIEQQI
ncbi:UNVERIFIED_CONTAM: hypothetical protein Sindi_0953100, partial [Sesamum indicum]